MTGSGPLAGLRVVEFAGIGPAPMCAMLLADLGAEVISVDRLEPSGIGIPRAPRFDVTRRGRCSVALDLKRSDGIACALDLVAKADALVEGLRPGTMERMGLGPDACHAVNPRLVYGRVTGRGQDGPLARAAGHDLNYIALSGALAAIGRAGQPPTVPLNLVGDYGGGGLLLAFGIVCALLEARRSGRGQVVDAAMAEGAGTLMASAFGLAAAGLHRPERGTNLLDSGAPHYDVYRCADGQWVADRARWPQARELLAARFAERGRAEWCALLEGTDACFAPVLSVAEAADHPHARARAAHLVIDGVVQPAPAPRFSRTPAAMPQPAEPPGAGTHAVLAAWGIAGERIEHLERQGIIRPL